MRILAIETSCDETAMSIVDCHGESKKPAFTVLANLINSQIAIHRPFGGVVPQLAKREHIKNLPILFKELEELMQQAGFTFATIDTIAVTVGPGLEPALWQGIEFAKVISEKYKKPLIGVNHMEGHMYSVLLPKSALHSKVPKGDLEIKNFGTAHPEMVFPAVGLVVSGGHTILVQLNSFTEWKKLGETRDDAAGEAFDKVARLLDLPYPGGPEIERLAKEGDAKAIDFPRPMLNSNDYDFSFSGLKTAVLYHIRDEAPASGLSQKQKADIAASFQQSVMDVLIKKAMRAAEACGAQSVFLCGGVAANKTLRAALEKEATSKGLHCFVPEFTFNTDNAVMIAAAAYIGSFNGKNYPITAEPNLNL